jgi:hypothetical protein
MSAGENLFLRVSKDCGSGVTVSVMPSGAGTITKVAHSDDGRITAAVIHPSQSEFRIVLRRPDGRTTTVHVELGPMPGLSPTAAPSTP